MKTTIALPDPYHRELKKLALDRSMTMADLIWEAVRERFFSNSSDVGVSAKPDLPLNALEGLLSDSSSSEEDIQSLKQMWGRNL